jgi:hypothetical protein
MLDQLTNIRMPMSLSVGALAEKMWPGLAQQEMARKSLVDIVGRYDLFSAYATEKLGLPLLKAAELETSPWHQLVAAATGLEATRFSAATALKTLSVSPGLPVSAAAAALGIHRLEDASMRLGALQVAADEWARKLTDSRNLQAEAAASWHVRWRENFRRLEGIQSFVLSVPKAATEMWPLDLISKRMGLIEHSIQNVSALQALYHADCLQMVAPGPTDAIYAADQFVTDAADLVRRLPPALPVHRDDVTERGYGSHRDEEVGAKLEALLGDIDPRLLDLRRQSWQKLTDGKAGARLAMLGLRELFGDLLRLLAPDSQVIPSPACENRADKSPARPTRRERIEYLMGSDARCLDAILQFEASVGCAHKFAHTFAGDSETVRVHMSQLENWIYLILLYARKKD